MKTDKITIRLPTYNVFEIDSLIWISLSYTYHERKPSNKKHENIIGKHIWKFKYLRRVWRQMANCVDGNNTKQSFEIDIMYYSKQQNWKTILKLSQHFKLYYKIKV